MTAQAPDVVMLADRRFSITAIDGDHLFASEDHGLEPQPISTGCYRGYIATYAVTGERLVLTELEVGASEPPPHLDGVEPTPDPRGYAWTYTGLALPIDFTGRLLLGDGAVPDSPYLNMGFWPAWMYADVFELRFDRGVLTEQLDRSAELATVRERIASTASRPGPDETTSEWISRTFSLTFEYSWPGSSPEPS